LLAATKKFWMRRETSMAGNQPQEDQVPSGVGLTAVVVAVARAAESRHSNPLFDDPFAADFVTAAGSALSSLGYHSPTKHHPPDAQDNDDLWSWLITYMPIRTRFFDDYFRKACAAGCRQVVILAAGLDTRAFRLSWPAGVRLFELDTPEVLAFKEWVLAERAATPACERRVIGIDLRQDWPAALEQAGFHPGEPTAWLAEGLLLYLTQDESGHLLDRIGQLSAPGSQLGVEYATQAAMRLMGDFLDDSPYAEFIKSLWRSGGQADPTGWLDRNGWQADNFAAAALARSYGRAMPDFTGPLARAARAADSGLIIARRL
jgi:methyltransferase (TIGR00027 family)